MGKQRKGQGSAARDDNLKSVSSVVDLYAALTERVGDRIDIEETIRRVPKGLYEDMTVGFQVHAVLWKLGLADKVISTKTDKGFDIRSKPGFESLCGFRLRLLLPDYGPTFEVMGIPMYLTGIKVR